MKKKIAAIVMAVVMVFALMGCSVSKTVTKTETVTDANGKTTTTTTITTNQNGTKTESTTVEESVEETESNRTVATLAFENNTEVDIYKLKFTSTKSDDWGDNVLGDNAPLENGETITFHDAFTYSADDTLWDLKLVDQNDESLEFSELDVSLAADPENITIVLTYNAADNTYSATVE